jgi:hypothetical protein
MRGAGGAAGAGGAEERGGGAACVLDAEILVTGGAWGGVAGVTGRGIALGAVT